MGHLVDETRPALTHVEQLDAFALHPLQVDLLHVRVHGHHLVECVDYEGAQLFRHPLVGLLEECARLRSSLVDVVEPFVVQLFVEFGDEIGVCALVQRDEAVAERRSGRGLVVGRQDGRDEQISLLDRIAEVKVEASIRR